MKLRVSGNPYGYRALLVYKKAEALQQACSHYTATFPKHKTLIALADQMDRSARSVKQNIVEGWKRNSTEEYYDFLGFSIGANAELEEDCDDLIKGVYKGMKGGEMGIEQVEKLPFYPLDPRLPLLIQLKLRCKELNFLLTKLQRSLLSKMREGDGRLKARWGTGERGKKGDEWLQKALEEQGLIRLDDGQLVPKKDR